jgi:hypothetical protein
MGTLTDPIESWSPAWVPTAPVHNSRSIECHTEIDLTKDCALASEVPSLGRSALVHLSDATSNNQDWWSAG